MVFLFGCVNSDSGGSDNETTVSYCYDPLAKNYLQEGECQYGEETGEDEDIEITDVSTDTDGTVSGSATLSTGEEIIINGMSEEAVTSTTISKSLSMSYNEDDYSTMINYSLQINSADEISLKIKFNETPDAIMAKDNTTEGISYQPFFNEDRSSHFNMNGGKNVSFFPLKSKSSDVSQNVSSLNLLSEIYEVPKRVKIEKDWNDISVIFDASLNVGRAELNDCFYAKENEPCTFNSIYVSNNSVEYGDLENGTYVLTLFESETDNTVWEQDIFIENRSVYTYIIDALAEKFAPILAMSGEENYFPTSLETIFQNTNGSSMLDLKFKLASIKGGDDVPYENLVEYLATNGHKESFNAVGFFSGVKDFFKDISGDSDKTVYYSFIQKGNNYYLNYHFLYAYDPKGTKEHLGLGNHVFDRESITLVFEDVSTNHYVGDFGEPIAVVFGAHLDNQTIKYNGDVELTWKGGRVYVPWASVRKSESHPIIPVALGSHALYPLCGKYLIYGSRFFDEYACGSDLNSTKLLLPEFIYDESLGDSYNLHDLKIGDLDSSSTGAFKTLMFSGGLVDLLGPYNDKFPPFTDGNREIDIENWVSFDADSPMNEERAFYWDIADVDSSLTDAIIHKIDLRKVFVDSSTGLVWQDNNYTLYMNWYEAVNYCTNFLFGGYSDWRLPTFSELNNLWHKKNELKSYAEILYWSSSVVTCYYSGVSFDGARVLDFESTYYPSFCLKKGDPWASIRCVRSSQ